MKQHPRTVYDCLLAASRSCARIQEVMIGLTWTLCRADGLGLCMSPGVPTRTLSWSGTLTQRTIAEVAPWVQAWDSYQACVGMAAINAAINGTSPLVAQAQPLVPTGPGNLAVFEYFLPRMRGQRVVVIGRYPGLGAYEQELGLTVLERQPIASDLPDPACEYVLPEADWVFLTATSIANKTFPRLVELSQRARIVLMGPTVPWLAEFADMGIAYLAGVAVTDPLALRQTIAEGGGTRIFETGVQYRVLALS